MDKYIHDWLNDIAAMKWFLYLYRNPNILANISFLLFHFNKFICCSDRFYFEGSQIHKVRLWLNFNLPFNSHAFANLMFGLHCKYKWLYMVTGDLQLPSLQEISVQHISYRHGLNKSPSRHCRGNTNMKTAKKYFYASSLTKLLGFCSWLWWQVVMPR